jgi:hypothetical protein
MQGRDAEMLDLVAEGVASPERPAIDFAFAAAAAAMAARVGRLDEATAALGRLSEPGLAGLPTSSTWLTGMVAIAETAALVGDAGTAGQAYRLLSPFVDLPVMPSLAVGCFGSAGRALGLVARAAGDLTGAIAHHQRAVDANLAIDNRPAVAISRADLADALAARAAGGDVARARVLWEQAHAAAVAMSLPARAEQWAARLRAVLPPEPARRAGVLAQQPKGWLIAADGHQNVLPDLQGIRYLAVLLERPGQSVTALELAGAAGFEGSQQEIVDRRALDAYRRRLRDLDADLAEADADGDLERARRLRLDRDAMVEHLRRTVGLGGRIRAFATSPERARTAVRKAVKRALETIAVAAPDLGSELATTITTGANCQHTPSPAHPRRWTVRR